MKRTTVGGVVITGLVLVALGGAFLWLAWTQCGFRGCPDIDRVAGYAPDEVSVLVDREGRELAKLYRVRRMVVSLDSLPAYVPAAFVAIEDRRFWEHDGVDWQRMLGALWANVRAREIEEGFSTITMQLARNLFPRQLPANEQTLSRKIAEMRVAMQIERRYGKRKILELYINQIYFGSSAWGIEAAAQEYFGKSAAAVTLPEAALLAGIPRAPARLSPRVDPAASVHRRNNVLRAMARQGVVPRRTAVEAMHAPLELARGDVDEEWVAPYFVEAARRRLEEVLGPALYTGGYVVHTTLDLDAQGVAEAALDRRLAEIEAGRFGRFRPSGGGGGARSTGLQGAVVLMETTTGDVLALVGGRDFEESQFNRATQADRQPGSAFKPFVYAAALDDGYPLTHTLQDTPIRWELATGEVWEPKNYGGSYAGTTTLRDALVYSRNVATVRLAAEVGLDRVIGMAHRIGIDDTIPDRPAVVLGASEVTPLDITAAYATFATLGRRPEPRFITHVEAPDGSVVWDRSAHTGQVLDPGVAFLVTDVLRDVVDRGTATSVRATGYRGTAAGKTGTTDDGTDVWFIGFTPDRVASVWIGFDQPRQIVPGATGGELAAPVWARIMSRVGAGRGGGWAMPPGVERHPIDAQGRPLRPDCAGLAVRREYFLSGTVPLRSCPAPIPGAADSLWPDPGEGEEEGWWDRLYRRYFGPDTAPDTEPDTAPDTASPTPPDTTGTRPARPAVPRPEEDTARTSPDTTGRSWSDPDPPDLLGRPAPPDTSGER